MASETETYIVAVERINDYSSVETECDPDETPDEALEVAAKVGVDQTWPQKGEISVRDLSLAYRRGGEYALHNLTFKIRSCEKVGICGRSGAGKSSLVSALYRLADIQDGTINIDGIDIKTIPLSVLRSRISIIPQDPTLFSGTLRRNLDPLERHSDSEIWHALGQVSLEEPMRETPEQLHYPVSEDGENWSDGQRQLICMARALLRNSKIIILDEATASVDVESDAILQQTIRNRFKNITVITIAHRVHTILDSDRVMVLDEGEIAEFDSPSRLLSKSGSLFSELMSSSKQAAEKAQKQSQDN
jgi:ABC-type multidrug transport system fused ATPase/permease subunit